ncbi:xylan 1,4-beta-xylosidase [Actinoplanes sp. NBRC 103695]|uniref:GH39 family glycosyl hydrolase n=1 Tax=Actinoplanes sp. NBRC 103695 TaxID=3032202 RepID=UPI0025526F78|nr:xylan 1,4-beta-xylosidase [Actinoplanes sp. NBRC 103695]
MTAQANWAALMGSGGAQDRVPGETTVADLPAPGNVRAVAGREQVTVSWDPVPGAIGYAVHRSASADGPFTVADFGGGDVLAVPHGPFADTTGSGERFYAVAALATVTAMGALSAPAEVAEGDSSARVQIKAGPSGTPLHRVWRAMVGSEHLSHLLSTDRSGGREIGAELRDALARAQAELQIATVRAHGILSDDFATADAVYDQVLALGYRPVVELGFMPRDLARDPSRTVFAYEGIISPPADWDAWAALIRDFAAHLIDRYGRDEVVNHWTFEVWNEANLSVFWSGTPQEYWRLYDVTARALRSVDAGIRVGGPATAAAGWIEEQTARDDVDFLSTHVYGTAPLDLRPLAGGRPLLWTEWGVTATHGHPINDSVFAAAFLLRGMRSAAGRVDALAPWVISDHFEELGRPERLIHGGFGLLTVGNLAKPKYWAMRLLERLGEVEAPVSLSGDGAGSLVEAWASPTAVLVWNGTLDQSKALGAAGLDRLVRITLPVPEPGDYVVRVWRVDALHGNVAARWEALGGGADWPDDEQWLALSAEDRLDEAEPARTVTAGASVEIEVDLPNPGIALVEVQPAG